MFKWKTIWNYETLNRLFDPILLWSMHDMHIEPKSYKFKLLGKLVVQHGIRVRVMGLSHGNVMLGEGFLGCNNSVFKPKDESPKWWFLE